MCYRIIYTEDKICYDLIIEKEAERRKICMGEEKKLFTRSFRIDEATMEKFKEISAEIGGNQQETIAKLIEAYEFQKGKQVLSGRAEDIGKFENYAGVLTRMYMSVIEDNQNMTQIVRAEYDAQLGSKDAVIQDLQGQLVTARQLRENAAAKAKSMTDEVSGLKEEISLYQQKYLELLERMENSQQPSFNLYSRMMKEDKIRLYWDGKW